MRGALEVVGAGPAGLAAAITLARSGRRVIVHEAQLEVGHRFGADLQGLENWSGRKDVMEVLREAGITTAFDSFACRTGVAFDAWNRRYEIASAAPLVYLVERGPRRGSLDRALLEQALALGVEVRFGSRRKSLESTGVCATGPRRADAIAAGYHFETDMAPGFWLVLDDALAPRGYAYLLVMDGRGTVKSCMFDGFRQARHYVERTVERFRRLAGLEMRNARFHAGAGAMPRRAEQSAGDHLVAGEQAGFQDALAGFGMRYALLSGVLAARAALGTLQYGATCTRRIRPAIEASLISRAIFARLGNGGYRWLLRALTWQRDARTFMHWLYRPSRLRQGVRACLGLSHAAPAVSAGRRAPGISPAMEIRALVEGERT